MKHEMSQGGKSPITIQKAILTQEFLEDVTFGEFTLKQMVDKGLDVQKDYIDHIDPVIPTHPNSASIYEDQLKEYTEDLEKQIETIKNTSSPKEAYFNILENKELEKHSLYLNYASIYISNEMYSYIEETGNKMLQLRLDLHDSKKLPSARIYIKAPYWTYDETLNKHPNYFIPLPHKSLSVLAKETGYNLFKGTFNPYPYKDLEWLNEKVSDALLDKEDIETEIKKVTGRRLNNRSNQELVKTLKDKLNLADEKLLNLAIHHNIALQQFHTDRNIQEEFNLIQEELKHICSFLNDRLGYDLLT